MTRELPTDPLSAQIDQLLAEQTSGQDQDLTPDHDSEELRTGLTQMAKAYAKQKRQIDRLVKLSDANEARLTDANEALSALTRNLSRFVPKTVVDELMSSGAEQLASTERREITVFFSDIVGFTEITERLAPEKLAHLMTEYFTEMAAICDKWGGTLDQFIGDAVVIFFGAPTSQTVHQDAKNAVLMALEMQNRLNQLRTSWQSQGLTLPVHVRMGLATGFCNVGNFGSETRLHYTALGNTMNEAARIQDLCHADKVLVSESCYQQVKSDFDWHAKGETILKGQHFASKLFEVAGLHKDKESAPAVISYAQEGFSLHYNEGEMTDKSAVITELETLLMQLKSQDQDQP